MTKVNRMPFVGGLAVGALSILLANWYSVTKVHDRMCFDCGLPAGFPFTMYQTDSFVGGGGFIAAGVFANVCVGALLGIFTGFLSSLIWPLAKGGFSPNRLR